MLKILFASHNPYIVSGYAIQLYYLINKLYEYKEQIEIRVLCFNDEGVGTGVNSPISISEYATMNTSIATSSFVDTKSRMYNELKLYFAGLITTDINVDVYWEKIHQVVVNYKCDKVICFMDIWPYEKYDVSSIKCDKYVWLPIHNNFLNHSLITKMEYNLETRNLWHLPYFNKIATFSTFGMEVLKSFMYEPTFINHVIDKTVYYNSHNKAELREKYGLLKNSYICLMIARNAEHNDRKGYLPQLKAFALFSKDKLNCKLLIHENSTYSLDKGITNLKEHAKTLGILKNIIVVDRSIRSKEHIRELYNLSDVLLCASRSEGFGVPMVEAQFCDLLVITNKCTSMPFNTSYGVCVEPDDISLSLNGENSWSNPSPERICEVLNNFYIANLDEYNIKPIDKTKYDINVVFEDWKKFLDI
jgi:glycosyltransferase involved in cell wall biosynthesis